MLVVDDEQNVLDSISAVLSEDVDVVTCTSAEHALKMLEAGRFHLVCADLQMPGMNGDELLRRVSNMPLFTSCLLITGATEYIRSKESNHHYVLLKPFDPARILGLTLQLARLADMKRSVHSLTDSLAAPDSQAPAHGSSPFSRGEDAPESSRAQELSSGYPSRAPAPPSSRSPVAFGSTKSPPASTRIQRRLSR